MKGSTKFFLLYIASMIIITLISWTVSSYLTSRKLYTAFANSELYDIFDNDLARAVLFRGRIEDDEKLDQQIVPKVFMIALYHPRISGLTGDPLLTLCKLAEYEKNGGFKSLENNPMKHFIRQYLKSVTPEVHKTLREGSGDLKAAQQALVSAGMMTPQRLRSIQSKQRIGYADPFCPDRNVDLNALNVK